jgi:CDK-activating kinase assembly factor MAT1
MSRFNRREGDFDSLRAYNDYLNDVEDITYNLIHNIDVDETRKKLQQYTDANQEAIEVTRKPTAIDGRTMKRYDDPPFAKKDKPVDVAADAAKKASLYNPFGTTLIAKNYIIVPSRIDLWDYLNPLSENKYKAGGYSISSFYEHAITDAYSGLGVFIGEEMGRKRKAEADVAIDVS